MVRSPRHPGGSHLPERNLLMDETRFDRLTRLAGTSPSRRGVLAAHAAFGLGARETAAAHKTRCHKGRPVGNPSCLPSTYDLQDTINAAPAGATIQLCNGTWKLPGTILIDHDLTLRAPAGGSVLDASQSFQVMGIRKGVMGCSQLQPRRPWDQPEHGIAGARRVCDDQRPSLHLSVLLQFPKSQTDQIMDSLMKAGQALDGIGNG
jgi:hypothetical protein